ncbi:hypothetical protein BTVI_55912 [Pitangus sulphuratus]|nr:hypothetical protein BTVI_55912 [Pitangus sulphuratus]
MYCYKLGADWLGSSFVEKTLAILVDDEPAMSLQRASLARRANSLSRAASGTASHCLQVESVILFLLFSTRDATSGMLSPVLSFLAQGLGHSAANPVTSHKDDESIGACRLCEEAERDVIVQPGEVKDQRHPLYMYKYLVGVEVQNMEADSSEWCPMAGQEATGRN